MGLVFGAILFCRGSDVSVEHALLDYLAPQIVELTKWTADEGRSHPANTSKCKSANRAPNLGHSKIPVAPPLCGLLKKTVAYHIRAKAAIGTSLNSGFMMSEWVPLFVLPNLLVKESVEVEYVALVSPEDPRCHEIAKTNTNFLPFLNSFTDAFQRQVIPSVLLSRADAPKWVMSMEAIGAFRDAISISSVVHNRTNTIIYGHARTNQYSTFFDFYAWVFSKDFNLLTTNNPALAGLDEFKDFKGQSTAGLPTSRWDGLEFDETLLKALFGEWPRRFSNPSPAWRSLALFRSLNMAYAAAQVPGFVDLTAQSLGRSVALWISAFEILTHPEEGDAGLKEVYRVFENVDWRTDACKQNIYECYEGRGKRKNGAPKRNLACWIYGELYHARNDYLHGNALADDRLVVKATGRSLFMFTQSLYRLLLTGFLGIDYYGPFKPREPGGNIYDTVGVLKFRFENRQGDHERAIAKILQTPGKHD